MTQFDKQNEVLNRLSQILHNSGPKNYELSACNFDYDYGYDDGSSSVGQQFWYILNNNKNISSRLNDPNYEVSSLVRTLHALMKEHTGGEWTSFTLTLDANGKATTKFVYPEK